MSPLRHASTRASVPTRVARADRAALRPSFAWVEVERLPEAPAERRRLNRFLRRRVLRSRRGARRSDVPRRGVVRLSPRVWRELERLEGLLRLRFVVPGHRPEIVVAPSTADAADAGRSAWRRVPARRAHAPGALAGCRVVADVALSPAFPTGTGFQRGYSPRGPWEAFDTADLLRRLGVPQAWQHLADRGLGRGRGVTVAVVDDGVLGARFGAERRHPASWAPPGLRPGAPWRDELSPDHGTMCAALAAGSKADGLSWDGVSPEAMVLSARVPGMRLHDVHDAFDTLVARHEAGAFPGGLVVLCPLHVCACEPPELDGEPLVREFRALLARADAAGIDVVFPAGNNHARCGHRPSDGAPDSIYLFNGSPHVLTVGAVDWDDANGVEGRPHTDSSRGPGQWSSDDPSPDVVAPSFGRVVYGRCEQALPWLGTSGAAALAAGILALARAADPRATPAELRARLRATATRLPHGDPRSVGAGRLDAHAALRGP